MTTVGKPITCHAAVVWKKGEPFKIETVEVAVPKKGEVRIKMTSTGLCHSDLHIQEGCIPDWYYPTVLGHEGGGVVESVGEGVKSVKAGDLVVLAFEGYCGQCESCKNPKTNLCKKQPRDNFQADGTTRITCKGQKISQMNCVSTFSEYTVAPEIQVAKVNPKADPSIVGLVGCCVPTGYGAVVQRGKMPPGANCAVWGLGGVGMCAVMGCRDSAASKIIGIDTNPSKFPLAKELGCTDFLNPKEVDDVPKKLAEMVNADGVDFCYVSVGHIPAMEQAFNSSHPNWGKTVVIGLAGMGETMRAGIWELLHGRELVGTFYGSYKARLAIPDLVEKVLKGQIQLEKIVSHKFPLSKINEGYRMLTSGESLRTVVDFSLK